MLYQFTQAHLEFAYRWQNTAHFENPRFITNKDNCTLNKSQGHEMLFFIRSLAKSWGWDDPDSYLERTKQLEGIIMEEMPGYLKTYAEIKQWIENRYDVK